MFTTAMTVQCDVYVDFVQSSCWSCYFCLTIPQS